MRFKIDWASLIVGSKFTVYTFFYFVLEGNFPSTSHWGLIFGGGDLAEGFCVTGLGVIFGGAYARRGLFSDFYGISSLQERVGMRVLLHHHRCRSMPVVQSSFYLYD